MYVFQYMNITYKRNELSESKYYFRSILFTLRHKNWSQKFDMSRKVQCFV